MPFDGAADRVAVGDAVPGIFLGLLDAQRDLLLLLVDAQHDDFDFFFGLDQFAGMADPAGPRHFADVDQSLDPFLQLDERPVAHHVDDRALDARADRIFLLDAFPRAGHPLLQAQGDLFLLVVDVQRPGLRSPGRSRPFRRGG